MFLSVLLKSFSQIAQKTSRRRHVGGVAILLERCEERCLLSGTPLQLGIPIPPAPSGGSLGGSSTGGNSGTNVPLTNMPQLNSLPGAPVSVILKMDGFTDNDPGWISFRDSGSGPIVTPAFDLDGDALTFSTEELRQMEEIWYRVAEDFAPFNVNVTTVAPTQLNNFEHVMVVIGGDGDWAPPAGGWGAIDGFSNGAANTNYVFSELFFNPHQIASASSHESGHTFGLQHQSTYDTSGTKVDEYNPGDANLAPLMGVGYSALRDTWWLGPNSTSATTTQDDLATLTRSQNRTVAFRADDHGNSTATASSLAVTSANVSATGIIGRNNDSDFFEFVTDDGPISFTVEGLNLRRIYSNNSITIGTNLDAVIRLYDSAGTLLDSSNLTTTLFGSVSANVTAGLYYVEVTTTGQYGAIGQFNLTGTVNPLETFTLTVNQSSVFENAGGRAATGTVSRSDFANLANPVIVSLTSSDTSEATVPATVTIPAGQRTATFPINAMDDRLADGTQRVDITGEATLGGELRTATAFINVLDFETISLTINPTTVLENAGNGGVRLSITRSNVDTLPPNTFSVSNNQLREHDYQGNLVNTRTIPWPAGVRPAGQHARDVVVMEDNRVAVYNGTSQAWLSILTPSNNTWQHIAVPELSSESAILAAGGISTTGNFVFLTDTKESATESNGIVRVDVNTGVSTRFGTRSPGYRMFALDDTALANEIREIDFLTGAVLNRIPMPVANTSSFDAGLAFDGSSLWVLPGGVNNDQIFRLNPDTGAILETHVLGTNRGWDGLASLNGLLYVLDDFLENEITVYDPLQRRIIDTLDVGTLNNINISGGLAAITGPDRLYVTSTFGSTMYEISPINGRITNQWSHGMSFAAGVATANNEVYVGQTFGRDLRVFNRQGLFQRTVRLADSGIDALGGDNVLTQVNTTLRYRDVYTGLDGKTYALDVNGLTVGRFNTTTLATEGFVTLARSVNALAADADGHLWGVSAAGILYNFNDDGSIISERQIDSASLIDIDLNITGQLLLTSATGRIYHTRTSGGTPTSFATGNTVTFGSFGRHQSQPAGEVVVQLTNSDPTAIRLPSSVIIPIGSRSVTVLADVIDDDVLDGTQMSTITATALGYIGTQTGTVTVLDAETVGVNIVAGSISEAAGPAATQVRVFRTDIDGPYSFTSTQSYSNSTPLTILDADKTTSTIVVPRQTSRVTDVNVTLSLRHAFLGDLDIFLVSPDGTRVELVTDLISSEPFMTDTTFDDAARIGILEGTTPFTGRFLPEGSLAAFNGENPTGTWTLEITDDNQTDFGSLFSWSLGLQTLGLGAMNVALIPTGDPGEIRAPQIVTIPANQSEITVPLDALDDTLLDGTRVAGLRAASSVTGYLFGTDSVNVLDQETLTLTVSNSSVSEAAGAGALTGTVRRENSDISSPFTVSLFSSDTSELTVPVSVTIPAGSRTADFSINAVDDNLVDGAQRVTIRVVAPAYGADKTQVITVNDLEPSLQVTGETSIVREDAGSFQVTVTRQDQSDISQAMLVNLSLTGFTGAAAPLTVPPFVTIPANEVSKTFRVTINDDNLLDGNQRASISASSPGIISGRTNFVVSDHETLSLSVSKTSIREDDGLRAARVTVTRSNTNISSGLRVFLTSSDISELTVPVSVFIPPNARSVTFDLNAVNDPELDGAQRVTITASATNYFNGTVGVNVQDHEPPVVTGPAAVVTSPLPVVTWNAVPLALRYDVLLVNRSAGVQQLHTNIPETRFTPGERLGIGRYDVFVRAVDQLERAGFWSLARSFKIETAPQITSPRTTENQVGGTFPEIAWTAVIDAAGYELVVDNETTGGTRVIDRRDLTTTSHRETSNLGSGFYRALVRAYNSDREFGQWSATVYFVVLAAPQVSTPVVGGTFERTPTIRWNAIAAASSYDVRLTNVDTNVVVFRDQSVPGTNTRVPQDLPNGNYKVEVRAQSGRFLSAWSTAREFSVGAPPSITSPGSGENAGSTPTVVWTGISGAETYELWIRNQETLTWVVQVHNLRSTSFTPSTPLPLARYSVFVRAVSMMGEKTAWSSPVSFIGGTAPAITAPVANGTTGRLPLFSWTAVAGANRYNLWVRNVDTNVLVINANSVATNSFTPPTNLAAGNYRVWVRAVSAGGATSAWSEAVDFTVSGVSGDSSDPSAVSGRLLASLLGNADVRSAAKVIVADQDLQQMSTDGVVVVAESEDAAAHDAVMAGWDHSEWWTGTNQTPENAT